MNEFTTYLPGLVMAYSAFLLAIASPGPNVLAVIGTSMSIGRNSGMALAMGVAAGSCCWSVLTVAGLSAVLARYADVLVAIKIFGGLYLLWLAYKAFKSASLAYDIEVKELSGGQRTAAGYALRGFAIQITNPKAVLAWIAIVSLGLSPDAPLWVGALIVAGTSILSVAVHLLYAVAFSTPVMVRCYSRARRFIQLVLGTFFALSGVKLLSSQSQ
jgi:threonine/homoserine/homoserine lactone efflux protein